MSSRLTELMKKAEELNELIKEERLKEQQRAERKIRYDAANGYFIVKVPNAQHSSGHTEINITLSDDEFSELSEEIGKENTEKIKKILEELKTPSFTIDEGWKRGPLDSPWGPLYAMTNSPDVGEFLDRIFDRAS